MGYKFISAILFCFLSSSAFANGLVYQVVESDLKITPDMVQSIKKDKQGIEINFTEEGLKKVNALIAKGYHKKLNIIFNDKIVYLALPIQTPSFSGTNAFISTDDEKTIDLMMEYFKK